MRKLRLLGVVWLVALGALWSLAAPATATGAPGGTELPVSGTFTGTGFFDSPPDCVAFHTWHDGSGTWTSLGDSTFHLDYCVTYTATGPSPLAGTFTIEAAGGTLTGDVTGTLGAVAEPEGFPVHYELTVTGGTGDYEGATGSLVFEASWDAEVIPVTSIHGTVSGSVILPPSTPSSVDDCRHGGWRDFVDHTGQPFRSQGHCIAWVRHHVP
jgi:hypothetical protein